MLHQLRLEAAHRRPWRSTGRPGRTASRAASSSRGLTQRRPARTRRQAPRPKGAGSRLPPPSAASPPGSLRTGRPSEAGWAAHLRRRAHGVRHSSGARSSCRNLCANPSTGPERPGRGAQDCVTLRDPSAGDAAPAPNADHGDRRDPARGAAQRPAGRANENDLGRALDGRGKQGGAGVAAADDLDTARRAAGAPAPPPPPAAAHRRARRGAAAWPRSAGWAAAPRGSRRAGARARSVRVRSPLRAVRGARGRSSSRAAPAGGSAAVMRRTYSGAPQPALMMAGASLKRASRPAAPARPGAGGAAEARSTSPA